MSQRFIYYRPGSHVAVTPNVWENASSVFLESVTFLLLSPSSNAFLWSQKSVSGTTDNVERLGLITA